MARAAEAGGILRAPAICAAAQSALASAEAEISMQRKKSAWSRSYREADTLAARALEAGQSCAAHARAALELRRSRAQTALADLEASIARTTTLARHLPDSEGAKDGILRATLSLGEGKSSFDHQQFERAEEAAGRGQDLVHAAVQGIEQFIEEFRRSPRLPIWKRWIEETLRESKRSQRTFIVVDKLRRQMLLLKGDEEIATYMVDLGAGGIESKTRAGDASTPEGRYHVTEMRAPGQTHYYRALMLDYPNADDRARFSALQRAGKMPRGGRIGSNIEIHGEGGRSQDWTQGCVALRNDEMDELVDLVSVGTPVTIVGMIPDGVLD
ncbi:MAG TPA: L,D-transpeptidase family protein [Patescibacteria group bacterium]|nr:L,D-transpeptidase family protein [Patescibacteria group bacterium]